MQSIKAIYTIALSTLMFLGPTSIVNSSAVDQVSGTLTYPQHPPLPLDAVVYITIVDVSPRQDASGDIVARQTITNPGRVPIPFVLKYNPARINAQHTYALKAHITAKSKLLFTNTSPYPVITRGNSHQVNVFVCPVK